MTQSDNFDNFKDTTIEEFEQALGETSNNFYVLRLYVAGTTIQSMTALKNLKKICEEYLQGRYELEVIDIYQNTELIMTENIVAVPTLIKQLPLPLQKLIGNLSDTGKVLIGLNLIPKNTIRGENYEEFTN